jgi:hypothetical protein
LVLQAQLEQELQRLPLEPQLQEPVLLVPLQEQSKRREPEQIRPTSNL